MPNKRINAQYANLRPEPSTDQPPITRLPAGLGLEVVGLTDAGDWSECEVVVENVPLRGWVNSSLLRDPINERVDRLVQYAGREYHYFDYGAIKESADHGCKRIKDYWAKLGQDESCTAVPWSAAFISFVVRKAELGLKFKFSGRHTAYLSDSKTHRNGANHAYGCFPLNHQPIRIGDMVAGYRTGSGCGSAVRTYDSLPGDFCSHVDLVVAIRGDVAYALGGNVGNSVNLTEFKLDAAGRVKGGGKRIAIMCRKF